jgi:hemerythrin-like domain-containing protein
MTERRDLIKLAGAAAAALSLPASAQAQPPAKTPGEDLMQEHGLVTRVFMIYRRAIELIEANEGFDGTRVASAAQIVSRVIHGHHEVEEENVIFPALSAPRELNMLTEVLRGQHAVAKALTARIGLEIADPGRARNVVQPMREFIAMYEPHGAYENTIVYPAFRERVGPERYAELARRFAERERALRSSFAQYAQRLGGIEDALGIGLAQFTATPPEPRRSS